jgi:N-methylhydantoinase B
MDPITAQVIGGRLNSIALEMARKLIRMGFSIIIKESEDIGAAITDADGGQLAEADTTPLQMGPIPYYVRGMKKALADRGEEINEGDVFIHNSPYLGASHSPDLGLIVPVFKDGELVAFSATTAHHMDIGCAKPGTSVIDAVDEWAGGLRFEGLKLRDRGQENTALWQMIAQNVRIPNLVIGDIQAQIAAAEIGARRLLDLMDEMGADQVFAAQRWFEDYSERMLRQEIAALPDGDYSAEGFIDGFPDLDDADKRDLRVAVTLRVRGDDLEIDLTGTAPQLNDLPLNMPLEGTVMCSVYTVVRSVLLDSDNHEPVPQNRGIGRPLTVTAPEGCLANPTFPAPTLARCLPACILTDTLVKAFARVVPERCCAGCGTLAILSYSGVQDGNYWVHMDIHEGSYGARWDKDGMDAMDTLFTNTRCAPVEEIETEYPLRVERWELNDYEVGHGQFRGGKGGVREFRFLTDGYISSEADGQRHRPWGLAGGMSAHPAEIWSIAPDGRTEQLSSKLAGRSTRKGEIYRLVAANGGGTGSPAERDPAPSASRRLKLTLPLSHSLIHSSANSPLWISPRIFFISAFVASVTMRRPRVRSPYSAVFETE